MNAVLQPQKHKDWMEHISDYRKNYGLQVPKEGLSGPYVIEKIYEMTKGDAIMVTEVGQHQMWAAQYYKYTSPRTLLTSGGLGTMGYGLGAAIGAQIARMTGRPGGARAVANACRRNPLCIFVPCHRVIAADGSLSGYSGGRERKKRLLQLEKFPDQQQCYIRKNM